MASDELPARPANVNVALDGTRGVAGIQHTESNTMIDYLAHDIGGLVMLCAATVGLVSVFLYAAVKLRETEKQRDDRLD